MDTSTGSNVGGPPLARWTARDEDARHRMSDQVAGIAGVIFFLLVVASFFTPDTPASDSSPETLARILTADLTGHQWSLFLGFLSDIAFLVLLAGVWGRLRRAEGPAGMFSALFAVAGTAFLAMILVSEGIELALVEAPAVGADPSALPALAVLDHWAGAALLPAAVAMFLGAACAVLSTRTLPAWLGWFAGLTALLLLVSVASVFDSSEEETGFLGIIGFASFILMVLWFLAASVVLLVRRGGAARTAA
jgi:hypothetical protein